MEIIITLNNGAQYAIMRLGVDVLWRRKNNIDPMKDDNYDISTDKTASWSDSDRFEYVKQLQASDIMAKFTQITQPTSIDLTDAKYEVVYK